VKDIKAWCSVNFDFIPCGLTIEQAQGLGLGESIDEAGSYQWESLSHEQARDLIVPNVMRFVSHSKFAEIEAREQEATMKFRETIKGLFPD